MLGRPEDAHRQELAGSGGLTEPRLVRRVDDDVGTALDDLSNEIREDVLPADRRSDHDRTGGQDRIVDRGNERAECGNDRPRPRHSTRQRLILGERHQHHLTIVTGDLAVRGEEHHAVVVLVPERFVTELRVFGAADQQLCGGFPRERRDVVA